MRLVIFLLLALPFYWLAAYGLWLGGKTIYSVIRNASAQKDIMFNDAWSNSSVVGGLGAVTIYLIVYAFVISWTTEITKAYTASFIISISFAMAIGYALMVRKPHPKDVKLFLIGSLLATVLFGTLMATVAVPYSLT